MFLVRQTVRSDDGTYLFRLEDLFIGKLLNHHIKRLNIGYSSEISERDLYAL